MLAVASAWLASNMPSDAELLYVLLKAVRRAAEAKEGTARADPLMARLSTKSNLRRSSDTCAIGDTAGSLGSTGPRRWHSWWRGAVRSAISGGALLAQTACPSGATVKRFYKAHEHARQVTFLFFFWAARRTFAFAFRFALVRRGVAPGLPTKRSFR